MLRTATGTGRKEKDQMRLVMLSFAATKGPFDRGTFENMTGI